MAKTPYAVRWPPPLLRGLQAVRETVAALPRRRLLIALIRVMVGFGIVSVLAVMFGSFATHDETASGDEISIPLEQIPPQGFKQVYAPGVQFLIGRADGVRVYQVPYSDGRYGLPDMSWERPLTRCHQFVFYADAFQCMDEQMPAWWREHARWNAMGVALDPSFPNLLPARFKVAGDAVMIKRRN
jgi:hypothetical protein